VLVINKHDAVADEDLIFNVDAFADKAVARDFAVPADARALLNLDERTYRRAVADFAAVEVYEVVDSNAVAEFDVGRDDTELPRHEVNLSC
jgi:hypothetical protein